MSEIKLDDFLSDTIYVIYLNELILGYVNYESEAKKSIERFSNSLKRSYHTINNISESKIELSVYSTIYLSTKIEYTIGYKKINKLL